MERLSICYSVLAKFKDYKNELRVIVITKWVHVLLSMNEYEAALERNDLIQKNDSNDEHYFENFLKIKTSLKQLKDPETRKVM